MSKGFRNIVVVKACRSNYGVTPYNPSLNRLREELGILTSRQFMSKVKEFITSLFSNVDKLTVEDCRELVYLSCGYRPDAHTVSNVRWKMGIC